MDQSRSLAAALALTLALVPQASVAQSLIGPGAPERVLPRNAPPAEATPPAPLIPPEPGAPPSGPRTAEEGLGLIEQGLRRMMEGLFTELEPALKGLGDTLKEHEPFLRELIDMIGDLENYHAPERLPNGDILLRRKFSAQPPPSKPDRPGPDPRRLLPPELRGPPDRRPDLPPGHPPVPPRGQPGLPEDGIEL